MVETRININNSMTLENNYCGHLSNEENIQVFKLLGNRCQSLCTTVVQLYQTQPPSHSQWLRKATGVLCFVKDNIKKNFFFRLFCLRRNLKLWELEMYNNLEYIEGTSFFHMFEGEECLVAFNFASVEDAKDFRVIVQQKIQARKRREEKRTRQISHSQTLPSQGANVDVSGYKKTLGSATKQAKRKRNITKADIGIPENFQHISHVGWNSTSGFDINTEDEHLKEFFKKAGVSEKQLQDKRTRDYIYDFIDKNGVREAFVKDTSKAVGNNNFPPPAVPPRGPPKAPHFRNAPPPPIPVKSNGVRKPKMDIAPPKKPPPAPIPGNAPPAPPAPPPPPPPMAPGDALERNGVSGGYVPPPPPPPVAAPPSPKGDMNSALLQSIRNGTTLRPVEEKKAAPQEDSRGDLLSEIRKGCRLKPVDERDVKQCSTPAPTRSDDLADALARALLERSRAIHSEDDDDDKSNDSTDSEWEV